ncbi:unnamed protein product [Allacma fusca]|uniref:Uncharacterized protein n=1 Tax=Allacma fusca TaxID=39272 RepID=A0A8J2NSL7_9HEXA|nr:unnamed protein product [Allacma fusca]
MYLFLQDVDTIYLSHDSRELCLHDFDHLEPRSRVARSVLPSCIDRGLSRDSAVVQCSPKLIEIQVSTVS